MDKKILLILAFFAVSVILGCAGKLEEKTASGTVKLNQVQTIGTRIGNIPPDFVVVTTEGKAVRLQDYIDNRRPIIVYFMATWCRYCAEDYGYLSKAYPEYESNVSFLSISLDLSEDITKLQKYKKKYPDLQKTMFAPGQEQILIDYGAIRTTAKYAIGMNGTIIYAGLGVFDEGQWRILLDTLSRNDSQKENMALGATGNYSTI